MTVINETPSGMQNWTPDEIVNIGDLTLRVLTIRSHTCLPNIYTLESLDIRKHYELVPHVGGALFLWAKDTNPLEP